MNINSLMWSAAGTFFGFLAIRFLDELLGLEEAARSLADHIRRTYGIPQLGPIVAE